MPAPRFCAACGARAQANARFCADCGARLDGGATAAATAVAPGGLRVSGAGAAVLGGFLAVGLGIWTAILSPAPAKTPLGASAAPKGGGGGNTAPSGGDTSGAEARKLIDDLDRKAKANPKDVETWNKLGLVYVLAAQRDPSFYPQARTAFEHVLELDAKQPVALRGLANVHHGRSEYRKAIEYYDRYLAVQPDDEAVRTELGTAFLSAGDVAKARSIYEAVLAKTPAQIEAQYFLAKALLQQGDEPGALAAFRKARDLAPDDSARRQIDTDIGSITGEAPPPRAATSSAPGSPSDTPVQKAVEAAIRAAPIMGERMIRFDWTAPAAGRAVVANFPMSGMPPEVRDKFVARLNEQVRAAQDKVGDTSALRVDIVDDGTQQVMATLGAKAPPPTAGATAPATAPAPSGDRTPFQTAVEQALRAAPIMGERIAGFEWSAATTGRVLVQNFPMSAMPDAVRDKFTTRLKDTLTQVQSQQNATGARLEIVDQATNTVMATITP